MTFIEVFTQSWTGYANWFWQEVTVQNGPIYKNYFWWLVALSAFFFVMELVKPWRENQPKFRKDFWLDFFYMFFNFFLFSLLIFNASSDLVVNWFNDGIKAMTDFDLQQSNPMNNWPIWGVLLTGFLVRDFVQWWVHRLLHRVNWLWQFHKVHHSVEQMGFAAHLRYHWMENVVYRTLEYIPLALMGINLHDFFIIHIFTVAVGHYNHSNLRVNWRVQGFVFGALSGLFIAFVALGGWANDWRAWAIVVGSTLIWTAVLGRFLKYVFNGPGNHIWHHAKDLPHERRYGVNFALSLSCWDYLFGTLYIPKDGRDIPLGFPGLASYPKNFFVQFVSGIFVRHKENGDGQHQPPKEKVSAK